MMFEGIYRNGVSSRDYPGKILFEKEKMVISFVDEQGSETTVTWMEDKVMMEENSNPQRVELLCEDGKGGSFLFSVNNADFVLFRKRYGRKFDWKRGFCAAWVIGVLVFSFLFLGLPFIIDKSVDVWSKDSPLTVASTNSVFGFSLPYTRLVKASEVLERFVSNYLWLYGCRVSVIEAPYTNAFATITGEIWVTRECLLALYTPDELAAVLYHEYGHLVRNHPLKMYLRRNMGFFFLMFLTGGHDISHLLVRTAEEMFVLRYSRTFEREADEYALNKLVEGGWSLEGMERLLFLLKETDSEVFWLFSTHPSLDERIKMVRKRMKESTQKRPTFSRSKVERDFRHIKVLCERKVM